MSPRIASMPFEWNTPPPWPVAVLFRMAVSVSVVAPALDNPPPSPVTTFCSMVQPVRAASPPLTRTADPPEFSYTRELVMMSVDTAPCSPTLMMPLWEVIQEGEASVRGEGTR